MEATRNIAHQFCPFTQSAVVWYDDCLLRYSHQNFFSFVSTEPSYPLDSRVIPIKISIQSVLLLTISQRKVGWWKVDLVLSTRLENGQEIAVKRLSRGSLQVSEEFNIEIIQIDETQKNTRRIAGTYGYMFPEYAMHGNFSIKSDVYSYEVLLLEIISGKKNHTFSLLGIGEDMSTYAWKLWNDGTPLEILESGLRDKCSRDMVIRCIHIALLCVHDDPVQTPSMASIVLILNSYSVTLSEPE
ncbi:hypothetical protein IC582_029490 [Cucumis melo]